MDVVWRSAWEKMVTRVPNRYSRAYLARHLRKALNRLAKAIEEKDLLALGVAGAMSGHSPVSR